MSKLTSTDISLAIDELKSKNIPVTVLNLHAHLGRGSFSTISKYLKLLTNDDSNLSNQISENDNNLSSFSVNENSDLQNLTFDNNLNSQDNYKDSEYNNLNDNSLNYKLPNDNYVNALNADLERLIKKERDLKEEYLSFLSNVKTPLNSTNEIINHYLQILLNGKQSQEFPLDLIKLLKIFLEQESLKNTKLNIKNSTTQISDFEKIEELLKILKR